MGNGDDVLNVHIRLIQRIQQCSPAFPLESALPSRFKVQSGCLYEKFVLRGLVRMQAPNPPFHEIMIASSIS